MTPLDLAWAAGLFEGEGSIRINVPTRRNLGALLVDVVNTDEHIVNFFHSGWGGHLKRTAAKGNRKAFWTWRAAALMAARFLREIAPYLRSPRLRERLSVALEFQAQKTTTHANRQSVYRIRQVAYYERMKHLNRRGNGRKP